MKTADHVSPDGELRLKVQNVDGDIVIGFHGYAWHTHGDILSGVYGANTCWAVRQYVDDILMGRKSICVLRKDGLVVDVWITDEPDAETADSGETIQIRKWGT